MPTAEKFKALGVGNGFPFCLARFTGTAERQYFKVGGAPTLKETMNAYWNFDKCSWGGAEFDPKNEPKDLGDKPRSNIGSDSTYASSSNQTTTTRYMVSNTQPKIFVDENGEEYYCHGIQFSYGQEITSNDSSVVDYIEVDYSSTVHNITGEPYACVDEMASHCSQAGPYGPTYCTSYKIGKSASEKTLVSADSVVIQGIPFVKTVVKGYYGVDYDGAPGANAKCPTSQNTPSSPSALPTLNLFTYN